MKTVKNINTHLNFKANILDENKMMCVFKYEGIKETMAIHLEGHNNHLFVVYNQNHLFNSLPNRCVFDEQKMALSFISKYGHLLNPEI